MEKVVCLSLGRNGTQSLTQFLVDSGYKTLHWIDQKDYQKSFNIDSQYNLMKYVESVEDKYDALTDISYATSYDFFNKKYKDAKFILITRDVESWIKSMRKHTADLEKMFGLFDIHPIVKTVYSQYVNLNNKTMRQVTDEDFVNIYSRHTETILNYFKDLNNFIHVDLTDPEIGKKISNFLNVETNSLFPKKDYS